MFTLNEDEQERIKAGNTILAAKSIRERTGFGLQKIVTIVRAYKDSLKRFAIAKYDGRGIKVEIIAAHDIHEAISQHSCIREEVLKDIPADEDLIRSHFDYELDWVEVSQF